MNHQAESDANMPLLSCLSRTWSHIQGNLFPWLTEELGPLTETHKQVVTALEVAGVEAFVQVWPGLPGRPPCDRAGLARAFVAKAVIGPASDLEKEYRVAVMGERALNMEEATANEIIMAARAHWFEDDDAAAAAAAAAKTDAKEPEFVGPRGQQIPKQ